MLNRFNVTILSLLYVANGDYIFRYIVARSLCSHLGTVFQNMEKFEIHTSNGNKLNYMLSLPCLKDVFAKK